jgi:hypothetical protein
MANKNLTNAKKAKNDEFYTQFSDIQKEVESYLEYDPNTFKGKIVYSNCDDPFESNFFRYFVLNFKKLGLKQLITTSYKPSPVANTQIGLFGDDVTLEPVKGRLKITANKFIINEVGDVDGDGSFTLEDIARQLKTNKNNEWEPLEGEGDFRSEECVELLKQADIVVTNPPFSLFREFITQLFEYRKQFLIIGNLNAITYKEVFPMIKNNKVWLGNNARVNGGAMFYEIPEAVANLDQVREIKTDENGKKTYITRVQGVRWFTNLDHGRLHQPIPLMTETDVIKFSTNKEFEKYENYNAIEVSLVKNIPSDYDGIMGVPISFLDKYSPEQFEIVGMCENEDLYKQKTKVYLSAECKQAYSDKFGKKGTYDLNASGVVIRDGLREKVYQRVLIKHKKI